MLFWRLVHCKAEECLLTKSDLDLHTTWASTVYAKWIWTARLILRAVFLHIFKSPRLWQPTTYLIVNFQFANCRPCYLWPCLVDNISVCYVYGHVLLLLLARSCHSRKYYCQLLTDDTYINFIKYCLDLICSVIHSYLMYAMFSLWNLC